MKITSGKLIDGVDKPISKFILGTSFFNEVDKETWFGILDSFIKFGGTAIDSARGYGKSENVIGAWLENRLDRENIVIITKCGLTNEGVLPSENYPELVRNELKISLQTLKTNYIDVYMLHRDNIDMTVAEILEPLNEVIAKGYVQSLGASNWTYPRVSEANEYAYKHNIKGFAVVSNNISLAVQSEPFYSGLISTDKDGEEWHKRNQIPLLPWSSQARGFFTGRYTPEMTANDGFTKRMIEVYFTDDNFKRLSRAKELGEKKGYTAVEVALAWLLHKPFPIVPLVGPHTQEELASCVKATILSLTESECRWLNLEE